MLLFWVSKSILFASEMILGHFLIYSTHSSTTFVQCCERNLDHSSPILSRKFERKWLNSALFENLITNNSLTDNINILMFLFRGCAETGQWRMCYMSGRLVYRYEGYSGLDCKFYVFDEELIIQLSLWFNLFCVVLQVIKQQGCHVCVYIIRGKVIFMTSFITVIPSPFLVVALLFCLFYK